MKQQIDSAKKTIREIKRKAPWLLAEYAMLRNAKIQLAEAQKDYKHHKKVWDALGRNS